jgi:hypothetical protein
MLDWLIIGGGIHGVHVAARLLGEGGVDPDALRIVDPADALLARWRACTSTTGMTHLRSPAVHHIDLHPWSLQRFAGHPDRRPPGLFAPPYDRPSLALFDAHCDQVIATFGLTDLHTRGHARRARIEPDGVTVQVEGPDADTLQARRVVLALGASEQVCWPDWAPRGHDRVHHVFEPGFDAWPAPDEEHVAVVGGGISAGQIALKLIASGHTVHLVSRHALREHQFDSDPGWLGPKHMKRFEGEPDLSRRRAMITDARHRGSVPPDVHRALERAIARGRLRWHEAEVAAALADDGGVRITLTGGQNLDASRVMLATGFVSCRPGGELVDDLVASANLPCAACGFPIVDEALCWHPRVHVTGPLAELELGPTSRNIAGARRAGDRLVRVAREGAPRRSRRAS